MVCFGDEYQINNYEKAIQVIAFFSFKKIFNKKL